MVAASGNGGRSWDLERQVIVWDAVGQEFLGVTHKAAYPSSRDNIAFASPTWRACRAATWYARLAFTEPAAAIKQEIADVTANRTIPAAEKKQMLEELNEALKAAQPIQFPGNIDLVKKYYDKIDAALN